jgi:hypothetical protein
MEKITAAGYEWYKKIFSELWDFQCATFNIPLQPGLSPLAMLDEMEARTPARARKALQMALTETLTALQDLDARQMAALNEKLRSHRLPDFLQLRAGITRQGEKIIKRGKINDEQEYYLIREMEADESPAMPPEVRERMVRMIAAYEADAALGNK